MKKWIVITALFVGTAFALAQSNGLALLNKARAAHGDSALTGLKTLRITSNVENVDAAGKVAILATQVATYDFENMRYKLLVSTGNQAIDGYRITSNDSTQWTPKGVKTISESQANILRYSFIQGILPLRLNPQTWTSINQTSGNIAGVNGDILTLQSASQRTSLLINDDGVIQAQRFTVGDQFETIFGGYQVISGIRFATRERLLRNGDFAIRLSHTKIDVNPSLDTTDFILP
jgi:hypothetical protein